MCWSKYFWKRYVFKKVSLRTPSDCYKKHTDLSFNAKHYSLPANLANWFLEYMLYAWPCPASLSFLPRPICLRQFLWYFSPASQFDHIFWYWFEFVHFFKYVILFYKIFFFTCISINTLKKGNFLLTMKVVWLLKCSFSFTLLTHLSTWTLRNAMQVCLTSTPLIWCFLRELQASKHCTKPDCPQWTLGQL